MKVVAVVVAVVGSSSSSIRCKVGRHLGRAAMSWTRERRPLRVVTKGAAGSLYFFKIRRRRASDEASCQQPVGLGLTG